MINHIYLEVFYFVVCFHNFALFTVTDKYSPRISSHYVYGFSGIRVTWGPPIESKNATLENYFIKWKNSTDSQYKLSQMVSKDEAKIIQTNNRNHTISANIFLNYHGHQIKPCSSYDIEVSAVFSDSSSTFTNITVETDRPEGSVLENIFCSSNSTDEIEVKFNPPPQDYYSACNFHTNYTIRAEGFSKWNGDKEEIPGFEASGDVVLVGLSPYTEYQIYVIDKLLSSTLSCKVTTLLEGPGPVILDELYSSSPTSIFASWSPPVKSYGEIKKYWLEIVKTKDNSKDMVEVQSIFTRVVLQKLIPNSEYKIVIWAENKAGVGEKSKEVTITTTTS